MVAKPKSYYRKKNRENYRKDKEIRKLYHEKSDFGETYTQFKKRLKKVKQPFN